MGDDVRTTEGADVQGLDGELVGIVVGPSGRNVFGNRVEVAVGAFVDDRVCRVVGNSV